jgi:hypothetical protein
MSTFSVKVTKKDLDNIFIPKATRFEIMEESVNSPLGFGQYIEKFDGDEVVNTYYHIYDSKTQSQIIVDVTSEINYSINDAGPSLWGITSEQGVNFLNGSISVVGLRKLKYCYNCENKNTPVFNKVVSYKKKYYGIKDLVYFHNTLDAYIFFDLNLPSNSNFFPAVRDDDGVNVNFYFKDSSGTDKTLAQVSSLTSLPVLIIETTIDESETIIIEKGDNTFLLSCCNERESYVIPGSDYKVGTVLYTTNLKTTCWYVESYTNKEPNIPKNVKFINGGRSCKSCITTYGCLPPSNTKYTIEYCCNGQQMIVDGGEKGLTPGTFIYFDADGYSSPCWYVVGTTDKKVNIYGTINGATYDDCKTCAYDTRRFC